MIKQILLVTLKKPHKKLKKEEVQAKINARPKCSTNQTQHHQNLAKKYTYKKSKLSIKRYKKNEQAEEGRTQEAE